MRLKIVLGNVVVIAILVVGCGGGGGDTSGGTAGSTAAGTTSSGGTETGGSETGETGGSETGGTETDGTETGESTTSTKTKPLSKTEFNTRVNEICIQVPPGYESELKELEKELKKKGITKKPSKAESNLKAAVPPLEAAIGQFESLTPPASEEQKLEEMIAAMENAVQGLEEEPTSELSGPKSPFAEFQSVSKKHGFETCEGL